MERENESLSEQLHYVVESKMGTDQGDVPIHLIRHKPKHFSFRNKVCLVNAIHVSGHPASNVTVHGRVSPLHCRTSRGEIGKMQVSPWQRKVTAWRATFLEAVREAPVLERWDNGIFDCSAKGSY